MFAGEFHFRAHDTLRARQVERTCPGMFLSRPGNVGSGGFEGKDLGKHRQTIGLDEM